jgi:hypothetical protein
VHQDEIFQFLEPANHLALGPWVRAWEWEEGLRNWAVPGLLGGTLELFVLAGVRHPWALAAAVWVLCAGAQALGTLALFRLVEERDGNGPALLAALVHATWGGWLLYAARPLGDSLSVAALLPALLFAQRRRGFHSGLCLGLACVIRYPSVVFALPIAVSLFRQRRELGAFIGGGLLVLLGLALLDSATWGSPLASVFRYLDFNLNHSQQFGEQPWWWYAPMFASMAPLLLSWHFLLGWRRRDLIVGAFATYLGTLILLAHKEPRFLVPLLPLFIAIAAAPALRDLSRLGKGALVAAVAYAASSIIAATVQRPIGVHAGIIDATVEMGRDPALTSALIAGVPVWNTGGRFYFGRSEPLYLGSERLDAVSHALVVGSAISDEQLARAGLTRWRSHGEAVVWKR